MSEVRQLLKALPLFQKLEEGEYEQLEELCQIIGVLKGTPLFEKGEETDSFYVIARGAVDIVIDADTTITLKDGNFFGEMGVLNSAPRNASALAGEDSILLRVMKEDFDRILAMDDTIASKVMSVCLDRGKAFAREDHGPQDGGEVAVFYSPRGGAGTTSLAVNMACRLADLGAGTVGLLDADLQFGNCHMLLSASVSSELSEIAAGREDPLTEEEVGKLVQETPRGVALVRSPQKTEEADMVAPHHLISIVEALKKKFGQVVVDTACALDDKVLALIDAATVVYIVAEPELVSLHRVMDCYRLLEMAGFPKERFRLVLNKAGRGGFCAEDIEASLKRKIYASVGSDRKASSTAIHQGKPVVDVEKGSPMSVGLSNLCRRHLNPLGKIEEEAPKQEHKAGFSFWGLFKGDGE
jgi:Flp pilus assembly CpaE family ATPase